MANKKVLVVDDEIHIVHVVAIKLRNNGYEVISAENGAQALQLVQSEKPDIVVTDFQMPIMNGVELIEKLRGDKTTENMPVILLTARGFAVNDEQKGHLQVSAIISKPFSPKELLRSIEDILYQKVTVVSA
jgi:two-component system, OmpR family, alkaline phosphatase synthesis response regulator PhoP